MITDLQLIWWPEANLQQPKIAETHLLKHVRELF
jgi:hypothetical protein